MDGIIYGSRYGTTRRYAEELARRTGLEARPFGDVDNINEYQTLAYLGALCAGGVMGMKKTFAKLANVQDKTIVIATVGVADPTNEQNTSSIKQSMARQLAPEVLSHAHIFHLRGGIDYSKLSLHHRAMMSLLCKKARSLPEEEQTAEVHAMLETYGKQVDFTDFNSLDQIVDVLT